MYRTLMKWGAGLCVVVVAGLYAYQSGSSLAESEVRRLKGDIVALTDKVKALEEQTVEQRLAIETERARAQQWQERYQRDVSTGTTKELFELVRSRLDAGVAAERLSFVVGAARNERDCDALSVTKRFLVQTPLYAGANDSVSFANELITVTAIGESALNADGNPEAWFDPAQSVTLQATVIGGESSETVGKLPLHHSVVVGDTEYRFSAVAGNTGFVRISADKCSYP